MQLRHGLINSSIISWLWSSPYSTIDHLSSTINVTVLGNWVWEQMTWVTCVLLLEWNSKLKWRRKDKKKQLTFFLNVLADHYSIELFEVILQMIHFLISDGQCAVNYILLEHSRELEVGGFCFMMILILILWAILKGNIGRTWPPSPKYYRMERGPAVPSYLPFYLTSITWSYWKNHWVWTYGHQYIQMCCWGGEAVIQWELHYCATNFAALIHVSCITGLYVIRFIFYWDLKIKHRF